MTASAGSATAGRTALEKLYSVYCYPVYAFIRRRGYSREDAQDFTQDFFLHLVEKSTLNRVDPQRGRFRSFLLGALKHFLAHAAEKARSQKRGGDRGIVFLDVDKAEVRYQLVTGEEEAPGHYFDAHWAAALVDVALGRLRVEMESDGKGRLFKILHVFLCDAEETSYQEIADSSGLTLSGVKTAIHRLRRRYGTLLREEVARTVRSEDEVDEELRYLRALLGG